MDQQNLNIEELMDLINLEDNRGIINKDEFIQLAMTKGIPRFITDTRGALRLTVERAGEEFSVTQHQTELSNTTINEVR